MFRAWMFGGARVSGEPTTTHLASMDAVAQALFRASPPVRYLAIYHRGELRLAQREGLIDASAAESDRYEELLVNPTLLTLTGQRGAIDCGGLDYLLIRYGNFFQLVHPIPGGHLSVSIEPGGDPFAVLGLLRQVARSHGLLPDGG